MPEKRELEAGAEEVPGETEYVSYIFALLCTGFLNDKSGYAIYR